jgi:hypothetical protein
MSSDLLDLLTVLYQGSVQKINSLQKTPILLERGNYALFFLEEDFPALAHILALPLPANYSDVLQSGLKQGIFQRSIIKGTECGANVCKFNNSSLPQLIYAYNPNMTKVNPRNQLLLSANGNTMTEQTRIHGSKVTWSQNRAPMYETRGTAYFSHNPNISKNRSRNTKCCSKQ